MYLLWELMLSDSKENLMRLFLIDTTKQKNKCHFYCVLKQIYTQESPPAWMQEAYRPPRSKCSLCWSPWRGKGGGTYPGWGVPTLAGGGTYPGQGVPTWGIPALVGSLDQGRYTHLDLARVGTPPPTRVGTSCLDLARVGTAQPG